MRELVARDWARCIDCDIFVFPDDGAGGDVPYTEVVNVLLGPLVPTRCQNIKEKDGELRFGLSFIFLDV